MHTPRHPSRRLARSLGLASAVLVVPLIAGCSSASAPPASSTPSASPASSSPSASPASVAPSQAPSPETGGSASPELPTGSSDPGVVDTLGRIVKPKPGQLDVHPISAASLSAAVDGRRVVITIAFWGGREPCSVLDSIVVQRAAKSFAITLREGHGPGDVVCMMIAESKRAVVDLGELEPGTYTISDATGGAPAIGVTVS